MRLYLCRMQQLLLQAHLHVYSVLSKCNSLLIRLGHEEWHRCASVTGILIRRLVIMMSDRVTLTIDYGRTTIYILLMSDSRVALTPRIRQVVIS